ncbi:putative succinate dehydrogenase, hydrophobic subunit [Catenovulum agarivorans DS-2]|uniref:Succinate dehydrogenase hydrophobic membrane anchor subunit n=1 Tax=Catenovulum agarivorans DS-2 TaxID=1328313 RepID=W7R3V1_9ALTE|nr:succinate dehydrogenase, hydrophobic membrane anchor protein [Catenovulum agarivorans]EWH12300.1 putative succinate dehydrogenase, hydrophobic subunit [Catenovulum agarivorans DS-2]
MVTNAGTLGRSGVHDFVLIRASALVLTAYAIFMVCFFVCTPQVTYAEWVGLFSQTWVKVFTLITLISLLVHAWIGLWQVLTDYVKPVAVRISLQFILNIAALAYLVTGIVVLWGV